MAVFLFIVFSSSIYLDNFTGQIVPFNLGLLPMSYIDFGSVINGMHNLLPVFNGLTVYSSGLLVLGITIIGVEIMLFISAKRVTRQRFMVKGAN